MRVQVEDLLYWREKKKVGRQNGSMCCLTDEEISGDTRCAARQGEEEGYDDNKFKKNIYL